MQIPETVKVGAMAYQVQVVEDIHDTKELTGRWDATRQVIEVRKTQGTGYMEAAFLHELLHAVHYHMGLSQAECPPREDEVDALANALHMVLTDNPEIFGPALVFEEEEFRIDDKVCSRRSAVVIDGVRYEAVMGPWGGRGWK